MSLSTSTDHSAAIARTVFTEQDRQAIRIRRFLIAGAAYVLAIAAVGLGVWLGLWDVGVLITYTLIVVAINVAFYVAFATGWNLKLEDPSLTEWQIMAATCALLFIVYHAGPARGIALLWVLLIFMFGVFRLHTMQLWRLAAVTWLAYSVIIYLDHQYHAGRFDPRLEIYQWLVLGAVLAWFTFMGGYVSALRARMRKSEAFYRTMWETAHDAVLIVNNTGQIDYANPAVDVIFGRSPQALKGEAILPLLPPHVREGRGDTFQHYLDSCKRPNGDWSLIETRFLHARGHEFPAEVSAAEMQVENKRVFLIFVRDITVRKQTEAALEAARGAAEASSLAKSQFMANMSHEVRTPMNGVLSMTEFLLQEPMAPRQREYIETIHRSSQSLMAVLNDVLDFSRIESGQFELTVQAFDLELAVRDTVKLFEAEAAVKAVTLSVALTPVLPRHVLGDATRVRQILSNLLDNAVKFTGHGHIEFQVNVPAPGKVRFDVIDTGVGIPAEAQSHIFDAFTQVDGSLTRRHGGTGLGLTIVKGLAGLMQGECGVDSKPGTGSRFWVTLPLQGVSTVDATRSAPPTLPQYPGKRVLLVEDDALNARIASAMLGARGLVVQHAPDGSGGVRAYEGHGDRGFDLVLMDCQMPVMDGFEATKRIREIERTRGWRRTPVSAFTAHAFSGYREQCLAGGMDDYISKPVNALDFDALLARWLSGEPA